MRGFVLSAPTTGCGKTVIATGIMRALADRHQPVAPFKTGPDYIDTSFHARATGTESVNLDPFFYSDSELRSLVSSYTTDSSIAVIEGAMGLFDGYDRSSGSSAQVAATLAAPVVLVVNARSAGYSTAPLLAGFASFDPAVSIAGVIFNNVGSPRHERLLRQAADSAGLSVYGIVPHKPDLTIPSRHLGLAWPDDEAFDRFVSDAAAHVSAHVDLDTLASLTLGINRSAPSTPQVSSLPLPIVAVARDRAFCFTYRTFIDRLAADYRIAYFSPLTDSRLPDCDLLYLPGGYPELHARQLAANSSMRKSIADYADAGGRIFAECGGLVYLCSDLATADGTHPMCGILPAHASITSPRLTLGYRRIVLGEKEYRGHEFHYSLVRAYQPIDTVGRQTDALNRPVDTPIYSRGNVVAGYTHFATLPSI